MVLQLAGYDPLRAREIAEAMTHAEVAEAHVVRLHDLFLQAEAKANALS